MVSRASRVKKSRISSLKKFHILRSLINSRSVKKRSIVMDAFLYICKLKVQLEAMRREVQHIIDNIQEVKVEKLQGSKFLIRVTCTIRQDLLVSILEELEKLKINVCQARIACKSFFGLEAIVEAGEDFVDVNILAQALHDAIDK